MDGPVGAVTLPYSGGWLDRCADRRRDPDWVTRIRLAPGTRVIPLWRDGCLVSGALPAPLILSGAHAERVVAVADTVAFLGLDAGTGLFAVDMSSLPEDRVLPLVGAQAVHDVRGVVDSLDPGTAANIAYGRGLLHWHRRQRFCGACGQPTEVRDGGHARACTQPGCGLLWFPRIEPAVIMLVEAPDDPPRCLLARHRGSRPGGYSTLAGFVETGESLEDAVRRELAEEAGVRVRSARYAASQAWPFPAGIMLGFRVVAEDDSITVDGEEVIEARWFTRADLRAHAAAGGRLGRVDSIDRYLLHSWLDGAAPPPRPAPAG